jgi:hypothetical protein
MNFTDYAAKEGCKLLRDDITFLQRVLRTIPKPQRRAIMLRYIEVWQQACEKEIVEYKKDNAGRRPANLWLLNITNTIHRTKTML